jgi:fatty-acyl-CoA synthase
VTAPTYAGLIHAAYRRYRDRTAFVSVSGDRLTYRACGALLNRLTRALQARGVRRGTGVALLSSNRPELSLAVAAALTLGGRVSLLPPLAGPERLTGMLDLAAVDVLLVDPLLEPLLPALALPGTVLGLGPSAALRDLLAEADRQPEAAVEILARPDDLAFVHFTSGSTGPAKAVTATQGASALGALLLVANLEWPADVRFLACTGMAQILQVPIRLRGGCVHLHNGFDPDRARDTILAEGITASYLSPPMLLQLARRGGPLPSLESLFYGGTVLPPAHLAEALDALGPVLVQAYSQVEVNTWATALSREEHRTGPPGSAGRPLPGVDVSVRDEAGGPVEPGTVGEVCLRGPTLTHGYWRDPRATAALRRDGWLRTGDDGSLDSDGHLHLLGRRADRLADGLWARQLEDPVCAQPAVAGAAAVTGPAGELVVTVVPRLGAAVDEASLRQALPERARAARIRYAPVLPVAPSGKLDRAAVRAAVLAEAAAAGGSGGGSGGAVAGGSGGGSGGAVAGGSGAAAEVVR